MFESRVPATELIAVRAYRMGPLVESNPTQPVTTSSTRCDGSFSTESRDTVTVALAAATLEPTSIGVIIGDVAAGGSGTFVLRESRGARRAAVAVGVGGVVITAMAVADSGVAGLASLWVTGLFFVLAAVALLTRVRADDAGLTICNPVTRRHIPWGRVEGFVVETSGDRRGLWVLVEPDLSFRVAERSSDLRAIRMELESRWRVARPDWAEAETARRRRDGAGRPALPVRVARIVLRVFYVRAALLGFMGAAILTMATPGWGPPSRPWMLALLAAGAGVMLLDPITWLTVRRDDGRRPRVNDLHAWKWIRIAGDVAGVDRGRLRLILAAAVAPGLPLLVIVMSS